MLQLLDTCLKGILIKLLCNTKIYSMWLPSFSITISKSCTLVIGGFDGGPQNKLCGVLAITQLLHHGCGGGSTVLGSHIVALCVVGLELWIGISIYLFCKDGCWCLLSRVNWNAPSEAMTPDCVWYWKCPYLRYLGTFLYLHSLLVFMDFVKCLGICII